MVNVSNLFRTLAVGERVGNAGPDLCRSPMKRIALMRDFRDAKIMARALRETMKAKAIEITHAEALELIAKAFGYDNWNILSAKIETTEPAAGSVGATISDIQTEPAPSKMLEVGEQVRVSDGPFTSFQGTVEEVDEARSSLKVAVSIFGMMRPVELEFGQVEKI
jgi:transcription antitermination factor NusG